MSPTKVARLGLAVAVVGGVMALAGQSFAGLKREEAVSITTSGTSQVAVGSVGTARASTDGNQEIGCTTKGLSSGAAVSCRAVSATNQVLSCTSGNSGLALAAAAIGSNSRLYIVVSSTGECTQLDVSNRSSYKPIVP